jgi:5-methylcytosine-specific restriction endonuclease McrA
MKIATLKPRLPMLDNLRPMFHVEPQRLRGSMLQKRNWRLLAEHPLCQHCQVKVSREVDHIIPLWAGGEDIESNLQALCDDCHKAKTAEEAGARAVGGTVDLLYKRSTKPRAPHLRIKNALLEPGDGPQIA